MIRLAKLLTAATALLAPVAMSAQQTIDIVYAGTKATVSIPAGITDVTATVEGANVSITSTTTTTEYTYRLSGSADDGSLTLYGDYKLTLQLAGLSLTNAHGGAAIDVECGKRIAVELVNGTRNTLADSPLGNQKAALYFKGHAEFEDHGTLSVTGRLKHAVCAKEYMELKASTGTINVLGAVSDGLHCGKGKVNNEHNYFLMKGGNVNIMGVGGDGIDADDYGTVTIEGGTVSVNTADAATALKADSLLSISGGRINIAVMGNDSEGLRSRYRTTISGGQIDIAVSGNGSKAIKGKRFTEGSTVLDGGFVDITGGVTTISVSGADYTDQATGDVSHAMGLSVDADYRQEGGTISITAIGPKARTTSIKGSDVRSGGTLTTTAVPWTINTTDCQYDMSAFVAVNRQGSRLTDYSGCTVGAFAGSACVGYAVFPQGADYGIMRIYSSTTDAKPLTFRFADNGAEYKLTPASAVSFAPLSAVGTPESPLMLACGVYQLGDVNRDKSVDQLDVEILACKLAGKPHTGTFNSNYADVDGDGKATVADLAQIIEMITGK